MSRTFGNFPADSTGSKIILDTTDGDYTLNGEFLVDNAHIVPIQPNGIASKQYVDSLANGLVVKAPCKYATTRPLMQESFAVGGFTFTAGLDALINNVLTRVPAVIQQTVPANGQFTGLDGRQASINDRILIKDETNQERNGIYTVDVIGDGIVPWIIRRAIDADQSSEMSGGTTVFVESGTINANTTHVVYGDALNTIDTTPVVFTLMAHLGDLTTADGIYKSGSLLGLTNYTNINNHITRTDNPHTVSHAQLSDKGINTHAQIDTHIGDTSLHFTQSQIDHVNILNKGVNTHAQIDTHIGDISLHFTPSEKLALATLSTNELSYLLTTGSRHMTNTLKIYDGLQGTVPGPSVVCHASYKTSLNLEYTIGTVTPVDMLGAVVNTTTQRLELLGGVVKKYIRYSSVNNIPINAKIGCIRVGFAPGVTGKPLKDQEIFEVNNGSNNDNKIIIWITTTGTNGTLFARIYKANGTTISTISGLIPVSMSAGTVYDIEYNYNTTVGNSSQKLYFNGTQIDTSTNDDANNRDNVGLLYMMIGDNTGGVQYENFSLDYFTYHNAVQHIASSYAPSLPEYSGVLHGITFQNKQTIGMNHEINASDLTVNIGDSFNMYTEASGFSVKKLAMTPSSVEVLDTLQMNNKAIVNCLTLNGITPANISQSGHSHTVANISDIATTYAPVAHMHVVSDIENIATTYAPLIHTHTVSQITDLGGRNVANGFAGLTASALVPHTILPIDNTANPAVNTLWDSNYTKQRIDNVVAGLNHKNACDMATVLELSTCVYAITQTASPNASTLTATANGELTIDGVNVQTNNRILVKNQAEPRQNGLYSVINAGSPTTTWQMMRTADADGTPTASEVTSGLYTFILSGNTLSNTAWVIVGASNTPLTILDSTLNLNSPIIFSQFSGTAQSYTQGTNISIVGNVISLVDSPSVTGILTTTGGRLLGPSGSVSAPTHGFTTSASTGIYLDGADLALSTTGTKTCSFSSSSINPNLPIISNSNITTTGAIQGSGFITSLGGFRSALGDAIMPAYSFTARNMGIYSKSATELGLSVSSADVLVISPTNMTASGDITATSNLRGNALRILTSGTESSPSVCLDTDNTGLFLSGGDVIGITTGGVKRVDVSGSGLTSNVVIVCSSGVIGIPAAINRLVLYGTGTDDDSYGLGISVGQTNYTVPPTSSHFFYAGVTSPYGIIQLNKQSMISGPETSIIKRETGLITLSNGANNTVTLSPETGSYYSITSSFLASLNGLSCNALYLIDGREITITNVGIYDIEFLTTGLAATSLAGTNTTVFPGSAITLLYNGRLSRWCIRHPYISVPVSSTAKLLLRRAAAQAIQSNTQTNVNYDTVLLNAGFTYAAGVITIPATGVYQFHAESAWGGTDVDGFRQTFFTVSSQPNHRFGDWLTAHNSPVHYAYSTSGIFQANAGDTCSLIVFHSSINDGYLFSGFFNPETQCDLSITRIN